MAHITKGLKLGYSTTISGSITYTDLTGLQDYPDLGGSADAIEITTLEDSSHKYENGLIDNGDSLEFTFLHDKTQFATMAGWNAEMSFQVSIPDGASGATGTKATFTGYPSVKFNGEGVNGVMTDTLTIRPSSAITFA